MKKCHYFPCLHPKKKKFPVWLTYFDKSLSHKTSSYLFRIEEQMSIGSHSYWPFFPVQRQDTNLLAK